MPPKVPRQQDPSLKAKVKNTFLEVSLPQEPAVGENRGRRSVSDGNVAKSPLVVAARSPNASPMLKPVDETMRDFPIEEVDFELLEEAEPMDGASWKHELVTSAQTPAMAAQGTPSIGQPAYVVPGTPSPFLHAAMNPMGGMSGYGMMPDMGLPPAFGEEGNAGDADGNAQNPYAQYGMPNMYNQYMPYGWTGMPMGGAGGYGMPYAPGGVGPDGIFHPGFGGQFDQGQQDAALGNGFAAGSWDQGGGPGQDANAEASGQKDGRRSKKKGVPPFLSERGGEAEEKPVAMVATGPPPGNHEPRATPQTKGGGDQSGGMEWRQQWREESGKGRNQAKGGNSGGNQSRGGDPGQTSAANQAAMQADEEYTTVMLRNIPNKYTQDMLIKQLRVEFDCQFDYMYLPIDFKNKCNVGYCFINFRSQDICTRFIASFDGVDVQKCLPGLNSRKVVEVTPARVQGCIENVKRLRNSPVMNQLLDHPEWMPVLFNEQGREEAFPRPDQALPPVKPRGRARVD